MAILQAINKLLESKLVQWLLVAALVSSFGLIIYQEITYGILETQYKLCQASKAKLAVDLAVQNAAILKAGEEAKDQQDKYDKKASEASALALQRDKTLGGIQRYRYSGECDSKVSQTLRIIQDGFNSYSGVSK